MEIWRRSTLRLYVSWIFVSGAIIIGFYHWGGLCVVCSSCHRSAVPMGMVCAHRGFHPFRGFHLFRGFSPTVVVLRTYGALSWAQQRFSVTGDFGVINHRGGLFVCSSCHRSAVQVWGDMLPGGYVLNGLHPRLLSIRTYGALPGCFCRQDTLHCGVGKLRRSDGAQPWVQPTEHGK